MDRSIAVGFALVCVLFASAARAGGDAEVGRYQIQPIQGGFVRLDTVTGQISHCRQKIVGWVCDNARDDKRSQSRAEPRGGKGGMSRAPEKWDGDITGFPPRGMTPFDRREIRKLRREIERLRKENEELRAMIEGDPRSRPRRGEPRMRFRNLPPDHPELDSPDHPELDGDGDPFPLLEEEEPGPHSKAPGAPKPDDEVGALPDRDGAPLPRRNPCAEKSECNADQSSKENADEAMALIDRMMERLRDLMRDMQTPKPQSL